MHGAHLPPTKLFRRRLNTTILEPRVAAASGRANTWCRARRKIQRTLAYTIAEKAIRFLHPDSYPDRAQKSISSSMSRHLSTRNISSKSMHAFLSNLTHRQTDKRTRANAFTSSFVEGNKCKLIKAAYCNQHLLCSRPRANSYSCVIALITYSDLRAYIDNYRFGSASLDRHFVSVITPPLAIPKAA